jgi:GntR family transcriptional regulator, transcriptional repressor for pyruvate dehydrogenase complex
MLMTPAKRNSKLGTKLTARAAEGGSEIEALMHQMADMQAKLEALARRVVRAEDVPDTVAKETAAGAGEGAPRRTSVADKLAIRLRDAITSGQYLIGSSLPTERELMAEYQVSRATVREALRDLGAQGLIKVKRGRSGGSFVSSPTSNAMVNSLNLFIRGQNIRFLDLAFAREAIEPAAAAQAAISRTEEQLEKLRLLCIECERTFDDVPLFVEANVKWHLGVTEASNNPLFITFLRSISAPLHDATNLEEFDPKTRKAVIGVHWQIFDAIRLADPDAARRRMVRHLSAYRETLSSIDLGAKMNQD